ncbi:hypothetical protein ACHQM5_024984 [Ranunculus cassubicifolius]
MFKVLQSFLKVKGYQEHKQSSYSQPMSYFRALGMMIAPCPGKGIKCGLAPSIRPKIVAKGTFSKGSSPEYEIKGIQLGENNVIVSVCEALEGYDDVLLR